MSDWQLKTPVAFLIFNRPDTTERVFREIRKARPPKLLVVADGPRSDHPGEAKKCEDTRKIIEQVDWDCEVMKNYSDINMGCKRRVSSGLDWVFETVEEAIILEDDCLPSQSFFRFCQELLEYYKDDTRVMHISGNNFQFGQNRTSYDYYFSKKFFHVWGWATWERAWRYYDINMKRWPLFRSNNLLDSIFPNVIERRKKSQIFEATYNGMIDTWDYQWTFSCLSQHALAIIPNKNMVSNIGFHRHATHTSNKSDLFANLPIEEIKSPLNHPDFIITNKKADDFTFKTQTSKLIRLLLRFKRV